MGALYQTIVEVLLTFLDSDQSGPIVGETAMLRQLSLYARQLRDTLSSFESQWTGWQRTTNRYFV